MWKEQKCIPLVGAETPLNCSVRQTIPSHGGGIVPRTETCINWGGPIAMVPCLHQRNINIQRKLRVARGQECIPLLGAQTPLTCAGQKTTLFHGGRYRAEDGNLRKLGWTDCHGTVFAPKKCLYPQEAVSMERTEMYSTSRCKNHNYL